MRRAIPFSLLAPVLALCCLGWMAPLRAADRDATWVNRRVRQWQPTEEEKRWEQIGWLRAIQPALQAARERNRPVFLFTLDGKMDVGRC